MGPGAAALTAPHGSGRTLGELDPNDPANLEIRSGSIDEVELYRVDGGGHTWPGSAMSATSASVTGKTTMHIDATQLMWDFFAAILLNNS